MVREIKPIRIFGEQRNRFFPDGRTNDPDAHDFRAIVTPAASPVAPEKTGDDVDGPKDSSAIEPALLLPPDSLDPENSTVRTELEEAENSLLELPEEAVFAEKDLKNPLMDR